MFRLDFTRSALALAGAYTVDGEDMDVWLPRFIATYAHGPRYNVVTTSSGTIPGHTTRHVSDPGYPHRAVALSGRHRQ